MSVYYDQPWPVREFCAPRKGWRWWSALSFTSWRDRCISSSLMAGPAFYITKDLRSTCGPTGQSEKIRKRNTGFCGRVRVSGPACREYRDNPHDEPMCLDKTSMQWIKDSLADRPTHADQIGVMYMFSGAWVPDLHGSSHSPDPHLSRRAARHDHHAA